MSLQVALLLSTSGGGAGSGGTGTITTNASTYAVGGTVTATVTNGPAGAQNAVGLYHSTDDPSTAMPLDWKYLANNARTPTPTAGIANGSVTISLVGLTPDTYDVVLTNVPFVASATNTYYVSPTGNNAFDGHSTLTPWQTIAKVNAGTYPSGTNILFEGGQTFTGGLAFTASSWTGANSAANRITIGSYGTGRATITSGSVSGLSVINNAGLRVKDLIFIGDGASDVNGVEFVNKLTGPGKLPYIELSNLDVSGYGRSGIAIFGGYGPSGIGTNDFAGFDNVLIDTVRTHHNTGVSVAPLFGTAGINVMGHYGYNALSTPTHTNVIIRNCLADLNGGKASSTKPTGSGIFIGQTQFGLIEFSVANDNGVNNTLAGGPVGIWTGDSDSIVIQYCESYHNRTSNGDGGGYDIDGGCTNCIIQYCYSHNNDGHGFLLYNYADSGFIANWDNNTVRYCISENDGAASNPLSSITVASDGVGLTNVRVYNNTIYKSSATGIVVYLYGTITSGLVANNILYSAANAWLVNTAINPGLLFRGNNYWATGTFRLQWNNVTYSSLAAFRTGTGQEIRNSVNLGLSVDPLLNSPGTGGTLGGYIPDDLDAYKIPSISPMVDTGLDLFRLFSVSPGDQDFYGSTIPAGFTFDIGACESQQTAVQVSEFTEDWTDPTNGNSWNFTRWPIQEASDLPSAITIQSNAGQLTAGGSQINSWAHVGSMVNAMTDFDLRVTVELSSVGQQFHALHLRVPNLAWSPTASPRPTDGYEVGVYDYGTASGPLGPGTKSIGFYPIQGDAYLTGVEVAKNWGTGLWNIRVQMIGSAIKAKAWQGTEPGTWDIQVTNTLYAAGNFMMSAVNGSDLITRSATWDTLSIAAPSTSVTTFSDTFTGSIGSSWDPVKWPAQLGKPGTASKVSLQAPQGSAQADVGELYVVGPADTWARASSNCTDMGNFDLTCTIRLQLPGEQYHKIFVRSTGGWNQTGEPWRPTEGLEIAMVYLSTGEGRLYFTPIYQDVLRFISQLSVAKNWGTGTWNMRIQMIGNALKIKAWQGTEPAGWDISTLYDPIGSSFVTGTLRVSSTNGANGNTVNCKFDNMVVAAA